MRLRCTNCDAAFDGDRDARCPRCLRRTSVVQTMDSTAPPRDGTPAPWPDGTRCPLCIAHDVSAATFHFEIDQGVPSGSSERRSTVRCRCCDACRARVVALGRLRWAMLPVVALGTLAWPAAVISDLPQRAFGLEKLEAVMLTTLICALIVFVPLLFVDRANRALRKNLESSWLFRRVKARVQASSGAAHGADADAPDDHWRVLAEPRPSAVVTEATELLRS